MFAHLSLGLITSLVVLFIQEKTAFLMHPHRCRAPYDVLQTPYGDAYTNRGLSMSFGFDEVLSADDVADYQKRFRALSSLFPGVMESDLRALVGISPLLLVIGTDDFRAAVDRMQSELPFVDPSYAVSQRSAGLDLLLSFMSPTFDLAARCQLIENEIGPNRNLTEFIRRVPHALTPRYLLGTLPMRYPCRYHIPLSHTNLYLTLTYTLLALREYCTSTLTYPLILLSHTFTSATERYHPPLSHSLL